MNSLRLSDYFLFIIILVIKCEKIHKTETNVIDGTKIDPNNKDVKDGTKIDPNNKDVKAEFNTTEQTTNTEDPNAENTNSGFGRIMLYILAGLFILAILAAIVGCIVLR
ncbi:unnamed protein product [Schistosoma bovis]|nr:unnamed protein product [Schistosoma bovis]